MYEPGGSGRQRKIKVLVFSPNVSRYRFVYPIEHETTEAVIEACGAAWAFYGGVFRTLIFDDLKAVVQRAEVVPLMFVGFDAWGEPPALAGQATALKQ